MRVMIYVIAIALLVSATLAGIDGDHAHGVMLAGIAAVLLIQSEGLKR